MIHSDRGKDYYDVLGAHEGASRRELERLYKRMAARLHPDKGGSEEDMKSLNEAFGVLKDPISRKRYDAQRSLPSRPQFVRPAAPAAKEIGLFGHGLSALLCLLMGLFLLVLVRSQWIFFLWPLAILAVFVIGFGVLMARSAARAFFTALPVTSVIRRHTRLQEAGFWTVAAAAGYGVYLLLTNW
jgi:DnaJ domain